MDLHALMLKKEGRIEANIPHNSVAKRSIVAIRSEDGQQVRVIVKGAPELLIEKCSKTFDTDNKVIFMDDIERNYIKQNIMER